jgi:hypothetical protein
MGNTESVEAGNPEKNESTPNINTGEAVISENTTEDKNQTVTAEAVNNEDSTTSPLSVLESLNEQEGSIVAIKKWLFTPNESSEQTQADSETNQGT